MLITKEAKSQTDGRVQRTHRSRLVIIDAAFSLYKRGILVPTAQQVADESGLGIRTVFRHFSEMESLFIAADKLLYERYEQASVEKPAGDLDKRIDQLVSIRLAMFEEYAPYCRATLVQKWRYAQLDKQYRVFCNKLRDQIVYFLPETKSLSEPLLELLVIALSFEAWDKLHMLDKRSKSSIKKIVLTSVRALVKSV